MIDFKNGKVIKLKATGKFNSEKTLAPILVLGEEVIGEFQGVRDYVVFTNKRVIAVNTQGVTGKKKDVTSLPYNKIQLFSFETSGLVDMDSELELYFSGVGAIRFEFASSKELVTITRAISGYVLT